MNIILGSHTDFFTDRLCRIYSFLLFLIIAICLAREFQTSILIECWSPAYFTHRMEVYTKEHCTASHVFHVHEENINNADRGRNLKPIDFSINKLKYLPVLLSGQSLLFLVPWIFWKLVSGSICGLSGVVKDAAKVDYTDVKTAQLFANQLQRLQSTGYSVLFGFSYLLTKAMYWAVCLIQIAILAWFLDIDFFKYRTGHKFDEPLQYTVENYNTTDVATVFPRTVLCSFSIYQMGILRRYSVQCTLPVSDILERYMYVIWAWLIMLSATMAASGVYYFIKALFWFVGSKQGKHDFINRMLVDEFSTKSVPRSIANKFCDSCIKPGILLAFEIVEENGSLKAVSIVVNHFWVEFLKSAKIREVVTAEVPGCSVDCTPLVEVAVGSGEQQRTDTGQK